MEYAKLGRSGLDVSRLALGCMSFGDPASGWAIGEDESRAVVRRALELGINFFDTANIYSKGLSEEITGRALRDHANRDEIVVATKVYIRQHDGPNGEGLSRKAIMSEAEKSLKRLGMDYIDLYIIHRWDYHTPIEETMAALHDLVTSGKVRYIGASAMFAWQFQKALHTADLHGWTRFISMQNHYNLMYREEEREMMPLLADQGIASTPYSPLASGRLSRGAGADTKRTKADPVQHLKYGSTEREDQLIIDRVKEVAEKRGVTRSQVALAWLLHQSQVVSPIMGVSKLAQLEDSAQAVDVALSAEEIAFLEEPYVPHKIVGPVNPEPDWIHAQQGPPRR